MNKVDLVTNGEGQVSSYIKERKIVRFIKSKCNDSKKLILHEDKVIHASDNLLNTMYNRMISNESIDIKSLLDPKI